MINSYWINKRTREWGILESESGRTGNGCRPTGWGEALPSAQELLAKLEDLGFVLLDRIEFLLLSKAMDERGEPLSFSPILPDGPDQAVATRRTVFHPLRPSGAEALSLAA